MSCLVPASVRAINIAKLRRSLGNVASRHDPYVRERLRLIREASMHKFRKPLEI
jgi:hypothetical protein